MYIQKFRFSFRFSKLYPHPNNLFILLNHIELFYGIRAYMKKLPIKIVLYMRHHCPADVILYGPRRVSN